MPAAIRTDCSAATGLLSLRIRRDIDQRPDQPQESLSFRTRSTAQERRQFDMGQPAPGGRIRLMDDECLSVGRLTSKKPGIAVRASIQLSTVSHDFFALFGEVPSGRHPPVT